MAQNEGKLERRRAEAPADLAEIEARFQKVFKQSREHIAYLERNVADLAPYAGFGGDALFAAEVQRAKDAHRDWVLARERQIEELRAEVVKQDLDAALPEAERATIRARLTAARTVNWHVDIHFQSAQRSETDLLSSHPRAMEFALREDVLDLYTRDAAGRDLIPHAMLEELLPLVRDIGCGHAPHRMGGPPDAVQEPDTREDRTLLFQMFSDYPIGWMWGDVGALYVTIRKSDLKALRFDRIEADLQGGRVRSLFLAVKEGDCCRGPSRSGEGWRKHPLAVGQGGCRTLDHFLQAPGPHSAHGVEPPAVVYFNTVEPISRCRL